MIPLWLGVVILCVYGVLLLYLMLLGAEIQLAKLERRRNLKRHDYDEAVRLKAIEDGTW